MPRRLPGLLLSLLLASQAAAITLPPGFQDEVVATGLTLPMAVRFAPDGRVFVAEKSGLVKAYDFVGDPTPSVVADLRVSVHNYWDRGLLGFALHPQFPVQPWVYVLYTHNALPGGAAPHWPSSDPEGTFDTCPNPPGATTDGCVVTGRLSRLEVDAANQQVGPEHVLIENNWCQQFPSHSVGDLAFGPDGALYVSGGDGASYGDGDWGQYGGTLPDASSPATPRNPCGDPPGTAGDALTPPTAEGGALRAQDLRTPGDPVAFNGTVLRVDPDTGAALPDNPLWGGAALDDDRIVAYGLRNPFRITTRPGTGELWIGDVGWYLAEEVNRLVDPLAVQPSNFGWPCYEGTGHQAVYDGAGLSICQALYTAAVDRKPWFSYAHHEQPAGGDACPGPSSSISGIAFSAGDTWPAGYGGALFFADYSRGCIWTLPPGPGGLPDPAGVATFASQVPGPVMLERGPDGHLFYVEIGGFEPNDGTIHRIRWTGSPNHIPDAVATADVTTGNSPLLVHFDGSASSDADAGGELDFAWDLDGDGALDDATTAAPTFTYTAPGSYLVRLRVTDPSGASDVASLTVSADNTPPAAVITAPGPSLRWNVGDAIVLAGAASDPEQGALPAAALRWAVVLQHCPGFDCHAHTVEELVGVAGGTVVAPDHDYPSTLELRLTATDAGGLSHTTSVQLEPRTTTLRFDSVPSGFTLAAGASVDATPFSRQVIVGSRVAVGAPSPQTLGGSTYDFMAWSDGGAAAHTLIAPAAGASLVATFSSCGPGDPDDDGDGLCNAVDPCTGGAPLARTRLRLNRLGGGAGDDRLRVSGQLTLPISPSPVIDPMTRGMRILLSDAAGTEVLDVTLPGGHDAIMRTGWTSRGTSRWRYDGGVDGPGGIVRVTLRVSPTSGLVKFKVSGKNATYPLDTARVPVRATLVFDPPAAVSGRCGQVSAWPERCTVSASGSTVSCR